MKAIRTPLLSLLLLLGIISCERNFSHEPIAEESDLAALLTQAKSTFTRQTTNSQARTAGSDLDQLVPANWQPQWQQAKAFKFDGKNVIETPLLYNNKELVYSLDMANSLQTAEKNQHNGVTKAIFFKHSDGTMEGYVLKFVLDKDYKKKVEKDYKQLSLQAVGDFSGYLVFSNWKGETLDIYQYKNGRIVGSTKKRGTTAQGRMSSCSQQVVGWYWACITVYNQCCTEEEYDYDPGSVCCSRNYKYCSQEPIYEDVCTPDNPSEPDPNDNGGGGDPNNGNTTSTMDVEKDNLEPCNSYVYEKIVNAKMPSKVLDIVKNFDVRKDLTILLKDDNIGAKTLDGDTHQGNASSWEITLNTNALSEASQEYIAATIIHEVLHVYLGTGNDPDHETMAQKYVIPMANALINMGFNISSERAQALAWGGLQKTTAWQELVNIDKVAGTQKTQDILNINNYYKSGSVGLKCP